MKSVMVHNFAQVPRADIQRSSFDRSHGYKTTFNAGYLVPVYVDEALPGDTHTVRPSLFARLATPIVPIMDNIFVDIFWFAVPLRLLWDNFNRFMGEQTTPGASTDFLVPKMTAPAVTGYLNQSLEDYFGLPTAVPGFEHMALYHRAYNMIWNQWFRSQDLQPPVYEEKGDGPDDPANYALLRRTKRHDYFTSCLPWPQKGPSIRIPLADEYQPVISDNTTPTVKTGATVRGSLAIGPAPDKALAYDGVVPVADWTHMQWNNTGMQVSDDIMGTINQLRTAYQLQRLYERDARGGTRLIELIKSHFGVTSPDARMQRPEYLGGGSFPVNIHPIAQTSSTDATTPQGNLAAMGVMSAQGGGFTKSFTEHCIIMGLISARADLTYQQGLDRNFTRRTRWDYFWPALANIGEQAVLKKELVCQGSAAPDVDEQPFGYNERYAEYRYKPSRITGRFRSNYAQSLDIWHLSQDLGVPPTLNGLFISDIPPIERVIAVPTESHFLFDSYFKVISARPMPAYAVPGMSDHF